MSELDLCGEKKFIDVYSDLEVKYEYGKLKYLIDDYGNFWINEKKLSEGSYGEVFLFKSYNKKYQDIALKSFKKLGPDVYNEINVVNLFNTYKCKNFLNSKAFFLEDKYFVVMEKIDGDILNLKYSLFDNPIKIYTMFVNFIISSFECALKKGKIFTDIKEENIGYKKCHNGIRFCLLDYGSFYDIEEEYVVSTLNINRNAYKNSYFSNNILVVFGTTITLLNVRLAVISTSLAKRFEKFITELNENKNYPNTHLLDKKYFILIKEKFYSYFKEKDEFADNLINILELITKQEINVKQYLKHLKYYS